MTDIKERRKQSLLSSHPDLHVGACVPFYFCPRSVMLYVIGQANHLQLTYRGGQDPIVHLEADLRQTVAWAEEQGLRWAFTLSNAGSYYFEDRCDLQQLDQIDWNAVNASNWRHCKEGKQAEFLIPDLRRADFVDRSNVDLTGHRCRESECDRTPPPVRSATPCTARRTGRAWKCAPSGTTEPKGELP